MKQKIAVRAVVKKDDRILFLRRAQGRDSILGKYELLGGDVAFGEQPEDAIRRFAQNDTGVELETLHLQDAMGYLDPEFEDLQYIIIVFLATISPEKTAISLSGKYDKYDWTKLSDISRNDVTNATSIIMGRDFLIEEVHLETEIRGGAKEAPKKVTVFTDGGSRGNPGPSATGYVIFNTTNEIIEEGGEYLGITTNNQAEYQAVLLGLQRAKALGATIVEFKIDSMLIVNQMKGVYKVKNRDLWPIYERIKSLMTQFDKVTFQHVRREFNTHADGMVNKVLDEHSSSKQNPNRL